MGIEPASKKPAVVRGIKRTRDHHRSQAISETSASLLERLRDPMDEEAWSRFVRLYTPLLIYWGRKCGLQAEDAADLAQEVFAVLVRKLPEFSYDPQKSFRAWLRTVTLNQWRDRLRRRQAQPIPTPGRQMAELAVPDNIALLQEEEYRDHLVGQAMRLMRQDFEPATWKAFWEFAVEGRPAAEVAASLGMSSAGVYGAKFRVLQRLRQELHGFLE
jgi:RNA polymerase sigma-70 factor (ECF subfamily)